MPSRRASTPRGGIAGHPLQIVTCNDHNNPNAATQCGRTAVADPQMLGIIANSSSCSSQLLPILTKAGMASINDQFFCPEGFKSPQVFPFNDGTLADVGADQRCRCEVLQKPKRSGHHRRSSPPAVAYPPLVQSVVAPVGGKVVGTVYIPFTTVDMAPYAVPDRLAPGSAGEGLTRRRRYSSRPRPGSPSATPSRSSTTRLPGIPTLIKSNFGNPSNAYISEYYDQQFSWLGNCSTA